jgi:hypothetical protein
VAHPRNRATTHRTAARPASPGSGPSPQPHPPASSSPIQAARPRPEHPRCHPGHGPAGARRLRARDGVQSAARGQRMRNPAEQLRTGITSPAGNR